VSCINSAFEKVSWPVQHVLAMQTTCLTPKETSHQTDKKIELETLQYGAFNLGLHVGDCQIKVNENRFTLYDYLPAGAKIQWLEQVHGSQVLVVEQISKQTLQADASITRNKSIALAIMTADCLPILLSNEAGTEIAAIHGGWRPLAADIIAKTLSEMHTDNKQIFAWLGPCISQQYFEVGPEVMKSFIKLEASLLSCFEKTSDDKYHADLVAIATSLLNKQGVMSVSSLNKCTFKEKEKYYSYRRDQQTGRMASIICIP